MLTRDMVCLSLQEEIKAWNQFERAEQAHQLEGPTMPANRLGVWVRFTVKKETMLWGTASLEVE